MDLRTKVLVEGVNNLHDARYCAGSGVSYVSFPVGTSAGQVNQDSLKEIVSWIEGIETVVDVGSNLSDGVLAIDTAYFQTTSKEVAAELSSAGKSVFLKLSVAVVGQSELLKLMEQSSDHVYAFILAIDDAIDQDADVVQQVCKKHQVYLAGSITQGNIDELLAKFSPEGIVLRAAGEIETGLNDFDELADVIEYLDTDEFTK